MALGLLVAAAPARAQVSEAEEAAQDSSVAAQMLSVLRPSYSTQYTINRQTTIWNQNFDFGTGFGFMNFNNRTKFEVRRDSDRDEDRRDGRNTTDLRWFVIPDVPLHMNVTLGRRSVVRPLNENETDEAGLDLSARYKRDLLGLTHTVDLGGGTNSRNDLSVRGDSRSESKDSGINGNLFWKTDWDPFEFLSAEGSVRETRSDKTITLQTDLEEPEEQPSSSQSRILDAKVSFEPTDWLSADLTASDTQGNDEYFIVQGGIGDLERKVNEKTALTTSLRFEPWKGTDIGWRMANSTHVLDYRVRTEIASSGSGDLWEGTLKTRWKGTDIQSKLSHTKDRLEPAISDTTDTESNTFDGKVSKRLSGKFAAQFDWLVRAHQTFFLTFDPDDRLDKDELRTKLQPSLTYTPNRRWTANLSYVRTITRRVELNPARASQTKEDEDYTVNIGITYALSANTNLSQSYSIKALYTTFDYNADANRLLATQRIVTSANSQITPKVALDFSHRFTLQDSGPFELRADGSRLFARSLRKYRQELTAKIQYDIATWLSLTVDSRFLRTDDVNEATDVRTTFRDLQLQEGFSVSQNLAGGVLITATGALVRSNVRDSYFTLQSSLTKDF